MSRGAGLVFVLVVAAPGCSDDGAGTGGGAASGGATTSATGAGGAGGGSTAQQLCRGAPLDVGDANLIDGRGVLVECGAVSLEASMHDRGVARLRYVPAGESAPARASYAVISPPADGLAVAVGADATTARVCTDELLIEIDRASCKARVLDAAGAPISDDPEDGGFAMGGELGDGSRKLVRTIAEGERFYGFGERTGPLDKRGRTMTFWNTDAYVPEHGGYPPDADPLYQSIPFFIGLRDGAAYGVLLDNTHRLSFDMGSSNPDAYAMTAAGGVMDEWIVAGPSMRDVTSRYASLTGAATLPPRWTLGYHQSRWGYPDASTILAIADELRARDLPADAVWLDIQHMEGFRSFTWDDATFGDPSALVSALADRGMKAVAIIDPGIKVDDAWDVYTSLRDGGLFLEQNGAPYVGQVWPGDASFPDFSNPDARALWGTFLPRITDHGVRGLWIDMNEPSDFVGPGGTVPNDLASAGDGAPSTMAEMHNVYGHNEARATFEGMLAAEPDRRPFVLSRAGYAGIQRYAAVWTGDAPSTWPTLRTTLPMLLGMGLSGVPFVGSDVGGYSGGASPELFARWMQLGSISPFFRGHVVNTSAPQEPWQFGTEAEDISRNVMRARYELLPTLYSLFDEARRTGAPILRPLVFEQQDDPATYAIDDQAMLGSGLMVAPILEQGATTRTVYFPEGRWFEVRSGAAYEGPATETIGLTLGALPMFAREGAIIARGPTVEFSEEAPLAPLFLDVYPGDAPSSFTLYEDDGDSLAYAGGAFSRVTYTVEPTASGAVLRAGGREGSYTPPGRTILVRIRRADHGAEGALLDGSALAEHDDLESLLVSGEGFFYDHRDLSVVVGFTDTDAFELELVYHRELVELRPPVEMTFHVTLPAGTPPDTAVHIASSANGWMHVPLGWGPGPQEATGTLLVPRGEWLEYKYTRGDWATVEKWPGCVEATNRYELGAAHPVKIDTVFAWADLCD